MSFQLLFSHTCALSSLCHSYQISRNHVHPLLTLTPHTLLLTLCQLFLFTPKFSSSVHFYPYQFLLSFHFYLYQFFFFCSFLSLPNFLLLFISILTKFSSSNHFYPYQIFLLYPPFTNKTPYQISSSLTPT